MTDWSPSPAELARIDQARSIVVANLQAGLARVHARIDSDQWSDTEIFRAMLREFMTYDHMFTATYLAEAMWMIANMGTGPTEPT